MVEVFTGNQGLAFPVWGSGLRLLKMIVSDRLCKGYTTYEKSDHQSRIDWLNENVKGCSNAGKLL